MAFTKQVVGDKPKRKRRQKEPEIVAASEKPKRFIDTDEFIRSGLPKDDARVERVPLARRLSIVEVGPDHPVWTGGDLEVDETMLVRLRPPAESSLDPKQVQAEIEALGCAVRLAPAELPDAVIPRQERERMKSKSKRDIVIELADKSVGSDEDRVELRGLVEEVANEVEL